MVKRILKITLNFIIVFMCSIVFGISINSAVENSHIDFEIKNFKEKGIFQEEMSSSTEKYYKVSRETWMDESPSFKMFDGKISYGGPGDIIVGLDNDIRNYPIITESISYLFGGHTASVCYDEIYDGVTYKSNHCIESKPSSGVRCVNNKFWNDTDYQTKVIGLKVNATEEIRKNAFHYMVDRIGCKYNTAFIFGTKHKYYCSDLISRAYKSQGINLNYDGFYTSVLDLVCSPYTYISFYKEFKNNVNYYYYLG